MHYLGPGYTMEHYRRSECEPRPTALLAVCHQIRKEVGSIFYSKSIQGGRERQELTLGEYQLLNVFSRSSPSVAAAEVGTTLLQPKWE